ncbi:MAG: carboxypeptidase M32 [Planctomycetota bacterium]|jgi:carboxypeptidase Taq|nr:carboxypeptidase M32 [Planctomycetota bacterium]MDP6942110.1 carboxypeptidase M32 [Planctomycetota bacterium]
MTTPHEETLFSLWRELVDVSSASAVLEWDQETYMPSKGQEGRGRALSTLAGIRHRLVTAPELSDALSACEEKAEPGSDLEAQCREARRTVDRASRVSEDLAKALAEATSQGLASWQKARAGSDFSVFEESLGRIIELRREQAEAIDSSRSTYDVLMDEFEPGATESALAPVFENLCEQLSPLILEAAKSRPVDEAPAMGDFPVAEQKAFGLFVAEQMGFDFQAGRLDATTHPFCSGFHSNDVRITWRHLEGDFRSALYGIMHEAGHGLYEQGLPSKWAGTPIGGAVSLGIHESQSRLWENLVGRSRSFWKWALPHFVKHFPAKDGLTVDQLWPALHTARPSLIRVEADEATYNLHIAIRFDIERRLFAGEISVPDLPEAWDNAYEKYLGIRAENASDGVLQDIHWSMGAFGYFPTYSLGNLIACQLFDAAENELGDLDEAFAVGEFAPLRDWLGEKVHSQGSRWNASELVQKATGQPLTAGPFLAYIRDVSSEAYGLENPAPSSGSRR